MDRASEDRVMGRIASGEEKALSELYALHAQDLYNYAIRVLRYQQKADDALSSVFHSVWTGNPAWPDPAPPPHVVLASRLRDILVARLRNGDRGEFRDVDLWTVVAGREFANPAANAARAAISKSGVVSTGVLSLVYFGGHTIAEVAERMSMTRGECRSRLQVSLDRLAGTLPGATRGRASVHGGRFAASTAALALGAMTAADDPAFADHLLGGCERCESEGARYAEAAHQLPLLMPEVRLPADLLEKILFSVRLAGLPPAPAAAVAQPDNAPQPVTAVPNVPVQAPTADPQAAQVPLEESTTFGPERTSRERPSRPRRSGAPWLSRSAWLGAGIAVVTVLLMGSYTRSLEAKLERESDLVESLQNRNTDLLLKVDRLAGISGFFESKGVVTVLTGTGAYAGLTGRIVWDTSGGGAMLQILNPPAELSGGRIRVTAMGGESPLQVAEFEGEAPRDGETLYRFFPVEKSPVIPPGEVAVDLAVAGGGAAYRSILEGEFPARR